MQTEDTLETLPTAGSKLTARQKEVAILAAEGQTPHEIAAKLGIVEKTAGDHKYEAMRKLGLDTEGQLALWAIRNGHSAPPSPSDDRSKLGDLSSREHQAAIWLACGHTSRKVADLMRKTATDKPLSITTVSSHRRAAYRKLGVRNAPELTLYMLSRGMITTEGVPVIQSNG